MTHEKADIRFLLVRHGESEANVNPSLYSQKPDVLMNLTERGHAQAVAMGAFLQRYVAEHPKEGGICIFNSPYNRARQTAYEAFAALRPLAPKVREYDWLCEQNFGVGQADSGRKDGWYERYPDHARQVEQAHLHDVRHWAPKPDGESRADVAFRVKTAIDSAFREYAQNGRRTFVVVCHSVTLRQFVKSLLNLPYEVSDTFKSPDNCDVRLIERPTPESNFADHGYIWQSGVAVPAQVIGHPTTQQLFESGAYAWKAPAP